MGTNSQVPDQIIQTFNQMLENSQTKLIGPVIAYAIINLYKETQSDLFEASQIRSRYQTAVCEIVHYVGYNLHLGARFDNAYISREDRGVVRYGIVTSTGSGKYRLTHLYQDHAEALSIWMPKRIKSFLNTKLGQIVKLGNANERLSLAESHNAFLAFLQKKIGARDSGTSFEIVSFAILKVYLERFACRIYRDTRTFSHEGGTDLSTDFGAVYQIKKLKIAHKHEVDKLYSEIRTNFDAERIQDGRVVLIIDDITPDCKSYLLQKNSLKYLKSADLIEIASIIKDPEDRQKILRIIYEEFCREYTNDICARHNCDGKSCPILKQTQTKTRN